MHWEDRLATFDHDSLRLVQASMFILCIVMTMNYCYITLTIHFQKIVDEYSSIIVFK